MVGGAKIKYLFILLFIVVQVFGQTREEITSQKSKLNKIKKDITQLQTELNRLSTKETTTGKELDNLEQQIYLLDKIIINIRKQINQSSQKIKKLTERIDSLQSAKLKIKKTLNKSAVWLYKSRDVGLLDYLLDAKSFNEAYQKVYYFKYFNQSVQKKIAELDSLQKSIERIKVNITKQKASLVELAKQKEKSKKTLFAKEKKKNRSLAKIRRNKILKRKLLKQKLSSQEKISELIARLTEKEQKLEAERRKRLLASKIKSKREKAKKIEEAEHYSNINFNTLYGKMPWPVSGGKIIKNFGKIRNTKLKTVTLNSGIDIKVKCAKKVRAVAKGVVSLISWLPGFGSVVIVSHGTKYRTVYGHLTGITVEEGEKINAGEILGKVSEDIEGCIVHFEVWKGKTAQNPKSWLR